MDLRGGPRSAPERLAIHLGLALALLAALVWCGAEAWAGEPQAGYRRQGRWPAATAVMACAVWLQCLMGALVAGNGGGRVDPDWPLMGGRVIPDDYWRGGVWETLAHGPSAAQFNHRLGAYVLLALVLSLAAAVMRATPRPRGITAMVVVLLALLGFQAGLGVATLMLGDPLWLALSHQANAAVLLSVAFLVAWRARRA